MKMQKFSRLAALFTAIIIVVTALAACEASDVQSVIDDTMSKTASTKLDTPADITLDENYVLRWSSVANASSYIINIDDVNYSSTVPSLNLNKTLSKNGNYEAYIKALSNKSSYDDSEFSAPFKFYFGGVTLVEDGDKTTGLFGAFDDIYTREAYIGYGYDVIGSSYVNANEVKMNYRIFDADKLRSKNLIMIKDRDSEDYYISGNSLSSYQSSLEVKLSSKVSFKKAFSLSIKGKFKSTNESTSSVLFYEYSHTTKAYQLILQCDFEEYKEMLTAAFKRDLMTLDIGTLFTRYGTHVITSVIMGGRFDLDYTMMSDSVIDTASLSASVDMSLKAWGVNTSFDASVSIEEKAKENNTEISSESRCYGGDYVQMNTEKTILANYTKWLKTIEDKPALVGIRDINSLVPIWELLGDSEEERARKAELSAAFEQYGEDSYNSLLENYSINTPIVPTSLNAYLTDKSGNAIDENNISAGEKVYLKTEVEPSIAVYTKNVKFDKEQYVEYNSIDNSITINNDTPDDTTINITVNIGHGLSKNISVTVYKYFNVNFNTNGGSEVPLITKIRSGQKIDAPANPTKEGKVFSHWYYIEDGQELEFSFNQRIEKDMTLFADWENYYPIVTYIHNINYGGESQEAVVYGSKLSLPDLTEYGYNFIGYFADEDMLIPFDNNTEIKTETTVYVKWDKKTYKVTFEPNGGSSVDQQSVKYLEHATRPTTAKAGSTFAGWFKEDSLTLVFDFNNDVITKDTVLYAKWTLNPVSVNFDTHGGNVIDGQTIDYGSSLGDNLFTPVKIGYTFQGWFTEAEYSNRVYSTTPITADCTLHAKWEVNKYAVSGSSTNGTVYWWTSSITTSGGSVSLEDISYGTTVYWRIGADSGYDKPSPYYGSLVLNSENFTLDDTNKTAVKSMSECPVRKYTVSGSSTNGTVYWWTSSITTSGGSVSLVEVNYGTKLYWRIEANMGYDKPSPYYGSLVMNSDNFTLDDTNRTAVRGMSECSVLYATITFNQSGGAGGSGSATVQQYFYSYSGVKPNAPSRSGYIFVGYYDQVEVGSGTLYIDDNMNIKTAFTTSTKTLYAHWVKSCSTTDIRTSGHETVRRDNAEDRLVTDNNNGIWDFGEGHVTSGYSTSELTELKRIGYVNFKVDVDIDVKEPWDNDLCWVWIAVRIQDGNMLVNGEPKLISDINIFKLGIDSILRAKGKDENAWVSQSSGIPQLHLVTKSISIDSIENNGYEVGLYYGATGQGKNAWYVGQTNITIIPTKETTVAKIVAVGSGFNENWFTEARDKNNNPLTFIK